MTKYAQTGHKMYCAHRFIWECFNGIIPDDKVIDHINEKKDDNRLCNLQLMTQQQNSIKSAKYRDFSYVSQNRHNRKCVRATNKDTGEVSHFNSLCSVEQHLGINHGSVKRICEGYYGRKSSFSKKDGNRYTFKYIKEEDLPADYKKSANIKPKRVSDEEKRKHSLEWSNKEYECKKCNKTFKNGNKYNHRKRCLNSQKQLYFWLPIDSR